MQNKVKIGALVSSGGSALINAYEVFNEVYPNFIDLVVATDRVCGIEDYCKTNNIKHQRIEEKDRALLSKKMADFFYESGGVDLAILFFMRIISKDFFERFITLNFHPSILPKFVGSDAVKQALDAKETEIGVSLHVVDEVLDGGQIIAQVKSKIETDIELKEAESLSFCQKIYITLWLFMTLKENQISFNWSEEKGFLSSVSENLNLQGYFIINLEPQLKKAFDLKIKSLGYDRFLTKIN